MQTSTYEILDEWEKDCNIDDGILNEESKNIPKLHLKYYRIYVREHESLLEMKNQLKQLLSYKQQYYAGQMTQEMLNKLGWKQFQRTVLKNEQKELIENDTQVSNFRLKIEKQKQKCDTLEAIIDQINKRNFYLKTILDFEKFKAGEY